MGCCGHLLIKNNYFLLRSRSFATRQLEYLEGKFRLHELMNSKKELAEIKEVPKRDYYNVRKVCTNGPFPFYMKFEKIQNRQKYHHSLKEHPMFSKIAKFGCEML